MPNYKSAERNRVPVAMIVFWCQAAVTSPDMQYAHTYLSLLHNDISAAPSFVIVRQLHCKSLSLAVGATY